MEVEALIADSVVSAEGKLYVQGGGWNQINVQVVPAVVDRIGLAILIRVPYTATNHQHSMELGLVSEDGSEVPLGEATGPGGETGLVGKIGMQFNVGRPPTIQAGDEQLVPFALNMSALKFESVGQYSFVISIDSTEIKRLTFRVVQTPQALQILTSGQESE
jgi:hypothetical protein